jgi:putative transposase
MIKRFVTKQCGASLHREDWMNASKRKRKESTLWQRRFWEHQIRDERDYERYMNYLHYNPVKHKYVKAVNDWPHSTFHRYVRNGIYDKDWGTGKGLSFNREFGVR